MRKTLMTKAFIGFLSIGVFGQLTFLSTVGQESGSDIEVQSPGVKIVPSLQRPDGADSFDKSDYAGYVMAYFKDQTQCAYLAVSRDGYTFTDLNNGEPIFDGTMLAEQKGVRDPHIARGPDGAFYLVMTDLHIFGQRAGHRDTRWQRPIEKYGWGNNRAIVMMKSYDLVHWTHADFRVDLAYPELGDIGAAWAPQTVHDAEAGKMMVYFTIRSEGGACHIYYSYPNDEFTKLKTLPEKVLEMGCIDGDITRVGDKFHLFVVSDAHIEYGVSDQINGGYKMRPERIDPNEVSTEAPNVFRRLGTDTYVLMYDVYGARPNNMGFSETTDFETYNHLGRFNEGVMKGTNFNRPKHGAVTYLTSDELDAIAAYWGVKLEGE